MTGTRPWGGTYRNDPVVEAGVARNYGDVGQYPWIGVLPAPGSHLARTAAEGVMFDTFRAFVYGYVQATDSTPVSRELLNLVGDCQRTLWTTGLYSHQRPGSPYAYAVSLEFDDEDLVLAQDGIGAEFSLPLIATIQDGLTQ